MNQHARALLCAIRRGRVRMEVHMNRDLTQWGTGNDEAVHGP